MKIRSYLAVSIPPKAYRSIMAGSCAAVLGSLSLWAYGSAPQRSVQVNGPQRMVQLPLQPLSVNLRSQNLGHKATTDVLHINLAIAPADPKGLQAFADSVSNPSSPTYRQFITPAQIGQRFGQSAAVVQGIANYLQQNGFKITLSADSRMNIMADCTVAQAEAAFGTSINNYRVLHPATDKGRQSYYAYSTPPEVPVVIAPYILAISGLESYTTLPHSRLKKHAVVAKKRKFNTNPLTPTQTRVLYDVAPIYNNGMQGASKHAAISSFDGFRLTNVPLYYKTFSLPTPAAGVGSNITVVTVDGGSGAGTPGGEADLDIQMVLGMAPLTNFLIYDGGGALMDVLTKEQNDNLADVISESYGWELSAADAEADHNLHVMMTAQGITYMEATGDNGTTLEPFSYSNYEPEVFQVGGTIANTDDAGNRVSEVGWSGSGGGWATESVPFNVLPSWQVGKGVPTNINFRLNPDVALNAFNDAGAYQFYLNGTLTFGFDGTSFASPVFCGAFTDTEEKIFQGQSGLKRMGRISDLVYSQNGRSDIYFDVTSGSNGTLPNGNTSTAGPFWDFVTGFGAFDFNNFATVIGFKPPQVLSPTSAVPFNNPSLNANGTAKPPLTGFQEGTFVSGSFSNLATADGASYVMQDSIEPQLGGVASVVVGFSANIDTTKLVSTSYTIKGTAPVQATVMVYLQNQTTGAYDYKGSYSGTQFGTGVTLNIVSAQLTTYMSTSGTASVLVRTLVPNSRLQSIGGGFQSSLDQLTESVQLSG